jgi:hypothetical protein
MDKQLQRQLQEDILDRYNNEEYWNKEIIENYEENKCDHEWSRNCEKTSELLDNIDELGIPIKCDKCNLEAIEWWSNYCVKDTNGNIIE